MECKYSVEVLHVKSLPPMVKDDVLYLLQLLLMFCGLSVCDAVERGMDEVHSEFQ